jgi:hypothetical protein
MLTVVDTDGVAVAGAWPAGASVAGGWALVVVASARAARREAAAAACFEICRFTVDLLKVLARFSGPKRRLSPPPGVAIRGKKL